MLIVLFCISHWFKWWTRKWIKNKVVEDSRDRFCICEYEEWKQQVKTGIIESEESRPATYRPITQTRIGEWWIKKKVYQINTDFLTHLNQVVILSAI